LRRRSGLLLAADLQVAGAEATVAAIPERQAAGVGFLIPEMVPDEAFLRGLRRYIR